MASDFIAQNELPSILVAAEAEGLIVLAVIVRPSLFNQDERLNQFQTVNSPSQPLVDMATGKRDVIFTKLAETIKDLLSRPGSRLEVAKPRESKAAASDLPEKAKPRVRAGEASKSIPKTRSAAQITREQEPLAGFPEELIRSPRIYVSAPVDHVLNANQREIKGEVLRAIFPSRTSTSRVRSFRPTSSHVVDLWCGQ